MMNKNNPKQIKLGEKLNQFGFKKKTMDGFTGKFQCFNLKLAETEYFVWYECDEELNNPKDFHYVINIITKNGVDVKTFNKLSEVMKYFTNP